MSCEHDYKMASHNRFICSKCGLEYHPYSISYEKEQNKTDKCVIL